MLKILIALALFVAVPAHARFHAWEINEIYKSPDGSVQFIELHTIVNNQQFTNTRKINSDQAPNPTQIFSFPSNTPSPTATHHLLIANAAFNDLACGVQSDFVLPDGFLYHADGIVNFVSVDIVSYSDIPLDGVLSLGPDGSTTAVNSPTNYNGDTCSIDLSEPTAVPFLSWVGIAMLLGLLGLAGIHRHRAI